MPSVDDALAILSGAPPAQQDQPTEPSRGGVADRALSMLSAGPDDLKAMRVAKSAPERPGLMTRGLAGMNTGLIAQTLGMPVDLATGALNLGSRAINTAGSAIGHNPEIPDIQKPVGGSESINQLLGKAGIGTAALPPVEGAGERIAEQVGQGAGAMLAPFGAARAGLLPAQAAKVLGAGPQNIAGAGAQQAAIGAGAGLGGGVASEIAPDSLKPYANIAGQLVGGGLTAGGMGLAQGAAQYGAKKIQDFRMPSQMAKAGEEALQSGAIPKAAPGSPEDVASFFTDRLNAADDLHNQHILDAAQQAKESADALGVPKSAQEIGKSMQGILDEAATKEKAAASKLYQAVDPDGTLTVPAAPLREQVGAIQKDIPQLAKPPSGEEAAIYNDVSNIGDSVPFSEVQALRSRVSSGIRQEVMASGGESPELRRLSQIKAAINDSLAKRAAEAAQADPEIFSRLEAAAGIPTVASEAEVANAAAAQGTTASQALRANSAGRNAVVGDRLPMENGASGALGGSPVFRPPGGAGQAGRRPVVSQGNPQVPQGTQPLAPRKPENIIDFLTARGGVFDEGGDLRAMDLNRPNKGQFGILSTKNGMSLDYAREAAEEAGFLKPGSTISDLLDAIQSHQAGHPVYRPEDAVDYKMHQAAARRGDFEQGGAFDPNDVFAEAVRSQGSQSLSEALDRLAAANQKYSEYKQTYRNGPVGGVLKPGSAPGTFATPESAVPGKLTSTPEKIAAFEKAAGSRHEAETLLHDHLASTIPRNTDGTIDIGRYPAWLDKTTKAGVFDAFPNLEARFVTAADAAKTMADANAQRLMAQRAHQKSAASLFTQGNDPVAAVGRALSGGKAEANMRQLWTAVKGNPEAAMGLKRAVVEHIRSKFGRQSEEGKGVIGNAAAIRFLRQNRAALRPIFGDDHLDQMQKIASAFHGGHGNDLVTAVIAGHIGEHVPHIMGHATAHGLIGKVIGVAKPFLALGAVIGKHAIERMRASGITRVDELMDEAMLNPRLARTMTDKLTPKNQDSLLARFGNQLAAVTAEAPQNQRDTTDAVTRAVSAMAPGEAITIQRLKSLSGRGDITDLRQQMLSRGLIKEQNGRYIRAETVNSGDALAKQPKGAVANPTILDRVHKAIQQRAPTLRRQSLSDLSGEIESRPSPYYGSYRPGGLVEHTAAVGQGTPLTHDVVHLLRRSGAIPREEWSVLSNKADDWAKKLGVEGPRGIRQEEAVAQAFNHWKAGDMQLPPGLRRIMGGITAVAERASA